MPKRKSKEEEEEDDDDGNSGVGACVGAAGWTGSKKDGTPEFVFPLPLLLMLMLPKQNQKKKENPQLCRGDDSTEVKVSSAS